MRVCTLERTAFVSVRVLASVSESVSIQLSASALVSFDYVGVIYEILPENRSIKNHTVIRTYTQHATAQSA